MHSFIASLYDGPVQSDDDGARCGELTRGDLLDVARKYLDGMTYNCVVVAGVADPALCAEFGLDARSISSI